MSLDHLTKHLLELADGFCEADIPLILGGGMGLFLRDVYLLKSVGAPRYGGKIPAPRTTDDLDLLFASHIIVSEQSMCHVRDLLKRLEYEVAARYFQFEKMTNGKKTKVDLLAAPPADMSNAQRNGFRIRPKGKASEGIHGYYTAEARRIDHELRAVNIEGREIQTPSAFNFLILKLHAFRDRQDRDDSDYGRHHAFDLYRVIAGMDESDWISASSYRTAFDHESQTMAAREIVQALFADDISAGAIRLRENVGFGEFADNLTYFLEDLRALFWD